MSNPPRVEIIPAKSSVCTDESISLDVLVRITPSLPEIHFPRPRLNIGLVIDRSGSMSGDSKMGYARQAASYVVEQLLPEDRVSLTTFDNVVETPVPSMPVIDKSSVLERIKCIEPRGSTDLHGGWAEGARQVSSKLEQGAINRVFLLSDGLANVGVTDPNIIASGAKSAAAAGVSTTTLGVGVDYNEDLMQKVATSADGHYYYVQSPTQLMDIFQTELHGLMATSGLTVSLGLEPGEGVIVSEVLNELEALPTGRYKLSNMIAGMTILVVVRLSVSARKMAGTLLNVRLAWNDPRSGVREVMRERLGGLATVTRSEWDELPVDSAVFEQERLLMAARAQKEAMMAYRTGDVGTARARISRSASVLDALVGISDQALIEQQHIAEMICELDAKDLKAFGKHAQDRVYKRYQSRGGSKPPEPPQQPPAK